MIQEILKMTVEEFLLAAVGEGVSKPAASEPQPVVDNMAELKKELDAAKKTKAEAKAKKSCLRIERKRPDVLAMINRLMQRATDAAFIGCCVEGYSISQTKLLCFVAELLSVKKILKQGYYFTDYVEMIKQIPCFEDLSYKTMARDMTNIKALIKKHDAKAGAIQKCLMRWMNEDEYFGQKSKAKL